MPLIERYVFRRTSHAFLLTLGALIAALWVTQVLRELDIVTAQGQAISVFLMMTLFALPALAQVVAPIAYLVATIVTLKGLADDGELPVIPAAGASPKAILRPILLLGIVVMIGVALSHHFLAPASLANFRTLLTHVRADVIASLVQGGRFQAVDDGLTMHFRAKAPDGSFRDIFVNDERDPAESTTFTGAEGNLLQHSGGSFLILQNGDLVRTDNVTGESNVVSFETYALDLSQLGTPSAAPVYKAKERSTLFLLEPASDDAYAQTFPQRVAAEIHERSSAPLYTLAFGLVALAFLARPQPNRQGRGAAVAAVIVICLFLRAAGFAVSAAATNLPAAIPLMYAAPLIGIAVGIYATARTRSLRAPRAVTASFGPVAELGRRIWERHFAPAGARRGA